jgi:hypothetical protein
LEFPLQLVSSLHRTENANRRQRAHQGEDPVRRINHTQSSAGHFHRNAIQKNVDELGDGKWQVKDRLSNLLDSNRTCVNCLFNVLDGCVDRQIDNIQSVAQQHEVGGFWDTQKTGDNLVVISCNHIELPLMSMAVWRAGGSQACLGVNLPHGD